MCTYFVSTLTSPAPKTVAVDKYLLNFCVEVLEERVQHDGIYIRVIDGNCLLDMVQMSATVCPVQAPMN